LGELIFEILKLFEKNWKLNKRLNIFFFLFKARRETRLEGGEKEFLFLNNLIPIKPQIVKLFQDVYFDKINSYWNILFNGMNYKQARSNSRVK